MSLPLLKMVPAGAGSGKTHTIQELLFEWIDQGEVKPEKIVAVTFTETAAAELKQRISARLVDKNKLDEAEWLDQAYISTIHGFGLRILSEFAFDAGLSPKQRLLNEDEQKELIKKALTGTARAKSIIRSLDDYGYSTSFRGGDWQSAEEGFRSALSNLVTLLRSLGWSDDKDSCVGPAKQWLTDACPWVIKDGAGLTEKLHECVVSLLESFPASLADEYGSSDTARNAFTKNFVDLIRAANIENLETDWALWKRLQGLRCSMRGTKLPDEYDSLAGDVILASEQLHVHPGPLQHELDHLDGLLGAAEEVLGQYGDAKREAALLDYTDMIALAAELLAKRDDVFAVLKSRVDCVIVDEFQDTNPLQFSLVWLLTAAGIPTLIVGDVKQAIMGFQGADVRLFESVQDNNPTKLEPLDRNWRTQQPLMDFLNDIGTGLFGAEYQRLAPQVEATGMAPLDVVEFDGKNDRGVVAKEWYAAHVVEHIQTLLEDGASMVKDRRSGEMRPLKPNDIAVLAPTHSLLSVYRDVLAAYGINASIEQQGWYQDHVVQIMIAALSYLADESDKHAALYLSVTAMGSFTLADALQCFLEGELPDEPFLKKLDACRGEVDDLSVPDIVGRVIHELDLYDRILAWPDADQERANLLRFQEESYQFVLIHKETLASGGYYGSGSQTFLAWLKSRVEDDDKQPAAAVVDEHAVVLKTWHSSKGLEWPVVVVAGLFESVKSGLPDFSIGYHSFDDLSQVLAEAQIQFSPAFDDPHTSEAFASPLLAQAEVDARRVLYVALTRAREKLVLEWPSNLKSSKAKKPQYWRILAESCAIDVEDAGINVNDNSYACYVKKTDGSYPDGYQSGADHHEVTVKGYGRAALEQGVYEGGRTPAFITPSELELDVGDEITNIESDSYGAGINIDLELSAKDYGSFVHRCIERFLYRPEQALDFDAVGDVELSATDREVINSELGNFHQFLQARYPSANFLYEIPVNGRDEVGAIVSGVVDLLIEEDDGYWIIDHKSDQVDDVYAALAPHLPQLMAYASIVDGYRDKPVIGIGINWVRSGQFSIATMK